MVRNARKFKWLVSFFGLILTLSMIFGGCISTEEKAKTSLSLVKNTNIPEEPIKTEVSDLMLGPGDEIEILVWRNDDLNRTIRVLPPGKYYYPLIGEIRLMGIGVFQLRDEISEKLSKYIKDPQVSITIRSIASRKFYVLGEVNKPGIFPVDTIPTALQAITAAGGANRDARMDSVLLVRGDSNNPELRTLNIDVALKEGNLRDNVTLQPGDLLYVPTTPIANVERFFRRVRAIIRPITDIEKMVYHERLIDVRR